MKDYLVRGSIQDIDPKLYQLLKIEEARQYRRLILIPSESMTPKSVRRALGSGFHNIYAEGYSFDLTGGLSEEELFDYDKLLTEYRRYSDDRYYKGVEYADILEGIACQRAAQIFSALGDPNRLRLLTLLREYSGTCPSRSDPQPSKAKF